MRWIILLLLISSCGCVLRGNVRVTRYTPDGDVSASVDLE